MGNLYRHLCARRAAAVKCYSISLAIFGAASANGMFCPRACANAFVQMDYNISSATRSRGTIFIEIFDDRPITRDNFLAYVNAGRYNNSLMHRLDTISGPTTAILQGGGYHLQYVSEPPPLENSLSPNFRVDLDGNYNTANPMITNEYLVPANLPPPDNVPRVNKRGTVAMARTTNPNSATSEFFFNIGDNTTLLNETNGGGYAVFAQVVGDGMNLLDAYTGLNVLNRNPDNNDDGTRDAGPFGTLPALVDSGSYLPLMLDRAKRVDYLGNGLITTVPSGGLTFSARDAFFDTGTVFEGASTGLTIGVGRTLGIREGYTLNRSLASNGVLSPGLSLGAITIQGNYFNFSAATLEIELGGTTPDLEYDKLIVTNIAHLSGGKLRVLFQNSFVPEAGDSFTFLTAAGGIMNNFTTFELPQLDAGLVWHLTKAATSYSISIVAADYDHNGIVDTADYVLWRKTRNTNVTPYSGADGNGDGIVNNIDYALWRNNIGNRRGTVGGTGSLLTGEAVPEPTCLISVLAVAAVFVARRRQR